MFGQSARAGEPFGSPGVFSVARHTRPCYRRAHGAWRLGSPTPPPGSCPIVYTDLAIFSGRAHPELAKAICARLGRQLGKVDVFEFSNENIFVQYQENIRMRDSTSCDRSVRP